MNFSDIPVRSPGTVGVAWWNSLRTSGILIQQFLGTFLGPTSFTIANNQVAAADVTGLLFDGALIRSFEVAYQIYRNTTAAGATELAESGTLVGVYKSVAATWEMTQGPVADTAGVSFTITAAGQVQYTSTSITGTPDVSTMKFKYSTMGV